MSRLTIRKWQNRDSAEDRSHRPHIMHATFTPAQELIVVAVRTTLFLPTDDLLHMYIKYLSQMPYGTERRYLFVAIDRATRWVFMEIYAD